MDWEDCLTNVCIAIAVVLLMIALAFVGAAIYEHSIAPAHSHPTFYTNCHPAERLLGKVVISGWDCTGTI